MIKLKNVIAGSFLLMIMFECLLRYLQTQNQLNIDMNGNPINSENKWLRIARVQDIFSTEMSQEKNKNASPQMMQTTQRSPGPLTTATSKSNVSMRSSKQEIEIRRATPVSNDTRHMGDNISQDWFTTVKENLTLVTAYWNLGSFRKGYAQTYTTNTYFNWASVFEYITNPLVVFTDSYDFEKLMKKMRAKFSNKTVIIRVNRTSLWPFKLVEQIRSVYQQKNYPKHHPNTVIPEYSCSQHAKYAVVAEAIRGNYFETPCYSWLDIGYFRDIAKHNEYFEMIAPMGLDVKRLAMNQVFNVTLTITPTRIFLDNRVWVGGGFFVGSKEIILKFEELYRKAVLYFLEEKLMNTDQQIIYSLYSEKGRKALKPDVELQLFNPHGTGNPWFYLGFHCRHRLRH